MLAILAAASLLAFAEPPSPLRGPSLPERTTRPSLVSYDMQGRLRELESTPEHEALRLLDLAPEASERTDHILAARAAFIDAFVSENLLLLGQLDTAGKAGDRVGGALLLADALEKLWPEIKAPPVRQRIAGALPPEASQRFCALISEYRTAWRVQARADAEKKGDHPPAWALAIAENAGALALEVGRSFERQASTGTIAADYLLSGITLTPEQRDMVRELKLDMLARTHMAPTEQDQQQLVLGIVMHLPEAERTRLIRKIANR